MANDKLTVKIFHDEIIRLLRIYFYQSNSEKDKEMILKSVKNNLDGLGELEHQKALQKEAERARKERLKYGIR